MFQLVHRVSGALQRFVSLNFLANKINPSKVFIFLFHSQCSRVWWTNHIIRLLNQYSHKKLCKKVYLSSITNDIYIIYGSYLPFTPVRSYDHDFVSKQGNSIIKKVKKKMETRFFIHYHQSLSEQVKVLEM